MMLVLEGVSCCKEQRRHYNRLYEETVKAAFAEAGVWPLNRSHILNHPAVREVIYVKKPSKKRAVVKIHNRIITDETFLRELKKSKKRKKYRMNQLVYKSK